MILQSLYEYYRRCDELPRFGLERKEFKYQLVIDEEGNFHDLACLLTDKKRGTVFLVPRTVTRSGPGAEKFPQLLWDSVEFVLGEVSSAKDNDKNRATALRKRDNFVARLGRLPEEVRKTPGVRAVLEFYRKGEYAKVPAHPLWADLLKSNSNLTFQLRSEVLPVTATPELMECVMSGADGGEEEEFSEGRCLVTGERDQLIRLMGATPVLGGQATASLVSFQKGSGYDSYGKEQCFNAPMGKQAEFACFTALKALSAPDSRNKQQLGDLTMLFWTQKKTKRFPLEDIISAAIREDKDDPNKIEAMRTLLRSAYSGKLPAEEAEIKYYFLGLAPNAGRISVRFWKTGTVGELGRNLEQHFRDFELDSNFPRPVTALGVLASLALDYKVENLAPNLQGRFLESIFDGSAYPETLLQQALRRIRADLAKSDRQFPVLRVGVLKAYLNRKNRITHNHKNKEITMSLDPENLNVGYRCGRLFAVLEKAQEEAINAKASIRDRFYGAASTTPITVFGQLLALNNHHLSKLHTGREINFQKLIGEILDEIKDFPAHLPLEDQARFALGYYQQNRALYQKKGEGEAAPVVEENEL